MDASILNTIITTSSTLIGVLIGAIAQPLFNMLDEKGKSKRELEKNERDQNLKNHEYKKEIYIEVLRIMRSLQIALEMENDPMFIQNKDIEFIQEFEMKSNEFFPILMIVSTDEIYNCFQNIFDNYAKFAFPRPEDPHLFEESKKQFQIERVKLSRLMKKDLFGEKL